MGRGAFTSYTDIPDPVETIKSIIIGLMVNKERIEREWTLSDLAKKATVSKSFISDVERGAMVKPGSSKLAAVAEALDIDINTIRNLNLSDIQKNDDYRNILKTFNTLDFMFLGQLQLNPQDVASMIRTSDDKGNTLAEAMKDLFMSRGITSRNIIEAIIRARQKETKIFNEPIENDADKFRLDTFFPPFNDAEGLEQGIYAREFQINFLIQYLRKEYGYDIDLVSLKRREEAGRKLIDTSWVFIKDEDGKPRLFIHPELATPRKAFLLAREVYFAKNNIEKRPWYTRQVYMSSDEESEPTAYEHRWNYAQGSYFAGAVLLPQQEFNKRLRNVFSKSTWDPEAFMNCAMNTTPTTFIIRLGELMNALFGIAHYSYVRFDRFYDPDERKEDGNPRKYQITSSFNTLQGVDRNSYKDLEISPNDRQLHHCRRWLAIDMTEQYSKQHSLHSMKPSTTIVKARRARYVSGPQLEVPTVESGTHLDLFVFSVLTSLPVANRYRVMSLAFECNDQFKELVKFWDDPQCTYAFDLEGHACELCNIPDCQQRVKIAHAELVDHWLLKEWKERKEKKRNVDEFKADVLAGKY